MTDHRETLRMVQGWQSAAQASSRRGMTNQTIPTLEVGKDGIDRIVTTLEELLPERPAIAIGHTLEEPRPRKGLTLADVTPLIGCTVQIARRDAKNKSGGGIMQGRLVAIAQDGAYWQNPPSLVIVAERPEPRPARAGLVPIDHVVQLTVEELPR